MQICLIAAAMRLSGADMTEETEDEMLLRIAKSMFGENVEITPVLLEDIRERYHIELAARGLSEDAA